MSEQTEMNLSSTTESAHGYHANSQGTLEGVVERSHLEEIRERISAISGLELNDHCNEYDAIHSELEKALSAIDVS